MVTLYSKDVKDKDFKVIGYRRVEDSQYGFSRYFHTGVREGFKRGTIELECLHKQEVFALRHKEY